MSASGSAVEAAPDDMPLRHAAMPNMSGSYELYISSGLYDRRYPRPNRRTLRRMRRHLSGGGRFVDIGGGTGRYTLPLLQLGGTSGVAHDICPVARKTMAERLQRFTRDGRLVIRGEHADVLAAEHPCAFDLALLAFGVLAHIPWHAERMRMLRAVHRMVKASGTLILSVPNARRRFRDEQQAAEPLIDAGALEPGDVLYQRGQEGGTIPMFYHLYTRDEVCRDLSEAGFQVVSVEPESLLSERTVVGNALLGWLDDLACRFAPATLGYDLLVVARPRAAGTS